MKQEQLTDLLVLKKRIGTLLIEVESHTRQLADAIDRQDEVSMNMILAMRSEPLDKLIGIDQALREYLDGLGEDRERIRNILNGDASAAQTDMERVLAEQAASNQRIHAKVMELDKILNRKIAKDKSIYG